MQSDIERFKAMREETKEIMSSMNDDVHYLHHNSLKCKVGTLKNFALDKLKGSSEKFWDFLMTPHFDDDYEHEDDEYYVSPKEEYDAYIAAMEKAAAEEVAKHGTIDMTNARGDARVRRRNNTTGSFEILLIVLLVSIALGAILALVLAN